MTIKAENTIIQPFKEFLIPGNPWLNPESGKSVRTLKAMTLGEAQEGVNYSSNLGCSVAMRINLQIDFAIREFIEAIKNIPSLSKGGALGKARYIQKEVTKIIEHIKQSYEKSSEVIEVISYDRLNEIDKDYQLLLTQVSQHYLKYGSKHAQITAMGEVVSLLFSISKELMRVVNEAVKQKYGLDTTNILNLYVPFKYNTAWVDKVLDKIEPNAEGLRQKASEDNNIKLAMRLYATKIGSTDAMIRHEEAAVCEEFRELYTKSEKLKMRSAARKQRKKDEQRSAMGQVVY